jgi:uncharacterized protein YkwD
LLVVALTAGCFVGASGEENPSGDTAGAGFASSSKASSSLVLIVTLTPVPEVAPETQLAALPTSTATATSTVPAEPTSPPVAVLTSRGAALATDAPTQPPAPVTPEPTETPPTTETPSPTATVTVTATPSATASPTLSPTPTATIQRVGSLSEAETQIYVAHNNLRKQEGLKEFRLNDTLTAIARERAQSMASRGVLSHYNADGTDVFDMMSADGYSYGTGSENIHYNFGYSPEESWKIAMQEWIKSPPHYASMVNPRLKRIGVGIAVAANGYIYYSVVFSD